jgi:hypothetical protein
MFTGSMEVPYSSGCELESGHHLLTYYAISSDNFPSIYFQGVQSNSIQFFGVIPENFISFAPNLTDDTVYHFLD